MTEEQERSIYWTAVNALREIVSSGVKTAEELIEEITEDL